MKNRIAPWMAALICAIAIHLVIIETLDSQDWFDIDTQPSTFELLLLPSKTQQNTSTTKALEPPKKEQGNASDDSQAEKSLAESDSQGAQEQQTALAPSIEPEAPTGKELSERKSDFAPQDIISGMNTQKPISDTFSQGNKANFGLDSSPLSASKPELLDLSKVSLSPDVKDEALTKVFSAELREKIAESKKAQKEYQKGLSKEVNYPITKDADGTRYVNIKGVCWRLPEEGSNEGWAIVFDGCGVKSKLFHFELNISPSLITNEVLGPDSPFNLTQPAQ